MKLKNLKKETFPNETITDLLEKITGISLSHELHFIQISTVELQK